MDEFTKFEHEQKHEKVVDSCRFCDMKEFLRREVGRSGTSDPFRINDNKYHGSYTD